jgi:hypothetical protein
VSTRRPRRVPTAETHQAVVRIVKEENVAALRAMLLLAERTGRNYAGIHTAYYRWQTALRTYEAVQKACREQGISVFTALQQLARDKDKPLVVLSSQYQAVVDQIGDVSVADLREVELQEGDVNGGTQDAREDPS